MAEEHSGTASGSGAAADLRTAWVEIDLGALVRNYRALARHVAPSSILAVVKADAYGHGAVEVARALEAEGAAAFGVATLGEGVELREAGIEAPVLVLSPVPDDGFDALLRHRLTPVLSSLEQLAAIAGRVDAAGAELPVHLKFDTGMSRLGIDADDAAAAFARLERTPGLRLAGLMSHLAEAETPESAANERRDRALPRPPREPAYDRGAGARATPRQQRRGAPSARGPVRPGAARHLALRLRLGELGGRGFRSSR
ncbi:MAG: alanine racemase [Thermoanaerobaculia bacterium]